MAVINYSSSVGIIGLTFAGDIYPIDHIANRLYTSVRAMFNFINV